MNYEHNKNFGLFKFQPGYRKLYLNSPEGYSRTIINAQTELKATIFVHQVRPLDVVNIKLRNISGIRKTFSDCIKT